MGPMQCSCSPWIGLGLRFGATLRNLQGGKQKSANEAQAWDLRPVPGPPGRLNLLDGRLAK